MTVPYDGAYAMALLIQIPERPLYLRQLLEMEKIGVLKDSIEDALLQAAVIQEDLTRAVCKHSADQLSAIGLGHLVPTDENLARRPA